MVDNLRTLGNKSRRHGGRLAMNRWLGRIGEIPSGSDARGDFQKHRHSCGVAVCALVVVRKLLKQKRRNRQNRYHHGNSQKDVEHHEHGAVGSEHHSNRQKQRHDHQHRQLNPIKDGEHRRHRAVQIASHLTAVVVRHHDHLASPTRSRRRFRRQVARDDVLTHTTVQKPRKHRLIEHLSSCQRSADEGHHDGGNSQRPNNRCHQRHQYCHTTAQRSRKRAVGVALEVFHSSRQTGLGGKLLTYVKSRTLFFLSTRRPGADLLRQICDMFVQFGHVRCLSSVKRVLST